MAKAAARKEPKALLEMPFFMAYMGPPHISPTLLVSRYFTARTDSAYLVERPKAAEIHIQTRAPGPPRTRAVLTPTMLPVPMVAARAVIRDWKGVISPSVLSRLSKILPTAWGRFRQGRNFSRMVRYTPVPTRKNSMTGPQTKLLTSPISRSISAIIKTSKIFSCNIGTTR